MSTVTIVPHENLEVTDDEDSQTDLAESVSLLIPVEHCPEETYAVPVFAFERDYPGVATDSAEFAVRVNLQTRAMSALTIW